MQFSRLSVLSLGPVLVSAFRDTSPFFAFSSSKIFDSAPQSNPGPQVALSSTVSSLLATLSDECPSDSYILVSQPGASASDFQPINSSPHLKHRVTGSNVATKSSVMISDVVGNVDLVAVKQQLISKCRVHFTELNVEDGVVGIRDSLPQLVEINFSQLPDSPDKRVAEVAERDSFLHAVIKALNEDSLTVVYATTPAPGNKQMSNEHLNEQLFHYEEKPFSQSLHMDLKRDLGEDQALRRRANSSSAGGPGLFETYNYMNAGIFQAAIAAIILVSVLYVGISAVAGIEVSYAAFSKEMGPAAQKRQQSQQQQSS